MKKEEAIVRINKIGNVSNILVRILKILLIVIFVFLTLGAVIAMIVPEGVLSMEVGTSADLTLDLSGFTGTATEEEKRSMLAELYENISEDEEFRFTMGVNGVRYEYDGLAVDETNMVVSMEGEMEQYTIELRDLLWVALAGLFTIATLYITLIFAGRLSRAFRDCQSPFEEGIVNSLKHLAFSLLPWVVMNSVTESVFETIFSNHKQIVLGVDLGVVIIIFFIFILAYIFQYGAVLQQESDETL